MTEKAYIERKLNDLMESNFKIIALQDKINQALKEKTQLMLYIEELKTNWEKKNEK